MSALLDSPTREVTVPLQFRPVTRQCAEAIQDGAAREIALLGGRGEGKTQTACAGMFLHAIKHQGAGYALPTTWLGAMATHESHKLKTVPSLREPHWEGRWHFADDYHLASFVVEGVTFVELHLFGTSDEMAGERLRAAAHGVWFDEAAPAAENFGRGLSREQWELAQTSLRLSTHAHVAVVTSNYGTGESDDWVWQRFEVNPLPGTMLFRLPKGEWSSQEQRERWAAAITDPAQRRRLLEGHPAALLPGRPVAHAYAPDLHLSKTRLTPVRGADMVLGLDGGLAPCSVLAQRARGRVEVLASFVSEHGGTRQHLEHEVFPWLVNHAPWLLDGDPVRVMYDPSMDKGAEGDVEVNPIRIMHALWPQARLRAGVNVPWSARQGPLDRVLGQQVDGHGLAVLDPVHARMLARALEGRWHYAVTVQGAVRREEPHKPNPPWADLGDAFCYLLQGMAPMTPPRSTAPPGRTRIDFDPRRMERVKERDLSKVDFSPFRGRW